MAVVMAVSGRRAVRSVFCVLQSLGVSGRMLLTLACELRRRKAEAKALISLVFLFFFQSSVIIHRRAADVVPDAL